MVGREGRVETYCEASLLWEKREREGELCVRARYMGERKTVGAADLMLWAAGKQPTSLSGYHT